MIGKHVSHYRILEKLDDGGMGVVFKAEDTHLGRPAALKFLPAALSDDADAKQRFIHEAKTASALDHPNICTIYEIGETDEGQLFIAMAYYTGETLHRKISRGPLAVGEAVGYVRQLAAGLARSHELDIIHRDIKPANVFVNRDGQVKILDFGLAKMLGEGITLTGLAQGTPAYMAPERIRNEKANPRTDLWALGVVLHEALAGERPFSGDNVAAIIRSVHEDEPPGLPSLRSDVPPGLAAVVRKLLQKEPRARYASCDALIHDLEELDSGAGGHEAAQVVSGAFRTPRAGTAAWPGVRPQRNAARLLLAALVIAAVLLLLHFRRSDDGAASFETGSPTLAILFFDNPTGDPNLDWMRTGVPQRMVEDISRSPRIQVLSIDQVDRILKDLGEPESLDDPVEITRQLAARASVDQVLLGNVRKTGETLQINIRLREASSGRVLYSRHVEVAGDEDLLSRVDDLSLRVRHSLELPPPQDPDLDFSKVTTSSIEAWQSYSEGMRLHLDFKEAQAAGLFRQAVDLDPEFAMAWAKLAVTFLNLRRPEARQHAAKALEYATHLPPRERYYIEGIYHSYDLRTWWKAIDALRRAVELDPGHNSARQNLALMYGVLERYDEAVEHGEALLNHEAPYRGSYAVLAENYAARGELERADELLQSVIRRGPGDFVAHCALGRLYQRWGRLDDAHASFTTAELIRPAQTINFNGICATYLLQGKWREASQVARESSRRQEAGLRIAASRCRLLNALYRGRSAEALAIAEQLVAQVPAAAMRVPVRLHAARIHLDRGEAEEALAQAQAARREVSGHLLDGLAILTAARAEIARGRLGNAQQLAGELRALAEQVPGAPEKRRYRHLRGLLALAEGRPDDALSELEEASSTLPQLGVRSGVLEPDHVPLWAALATAYRAAGNPEKAAVFLRHIVESHTERVAYPVPFVRSLYLLGEISAARGDEEQARSYFDRFREHWKHGDLERRWVARADR